VLAVELERELSTLVRRLRTAAPTRWAAPARATAVRTLVLALTEHARAAGGGAPPGMVPPPVLPHGLGDQVAVLGADLLAAGPDDTVAAAALADVRHAAEELAGARPVGR